MKQSLANLYLPDSLWRIMKGEEKCGKLRDGYYSSQVKELSAELGSLREKCRKSARSNRAILRQEILELKAQLDEAKQEELRQKAYNINRGKINLDIEGKIIKGHSAYVTCNVETMLVSQIIKLELRRSYKLYPSDMNVIVEQVKGLLDSPMPKVVIRADIHHFFESIPQQPIVQKLIDDGFVSRQTFKYLKGILFKYNKLASNKQAVGLPRGLSFSSHLSELYMLPIDELIKKINGVYYYKRYVDDIIIVADPSICSTDSYWELLKNILEDKELHLHEESEKKYVNVWDAHTQEANFEYLGYRFACNNGKLRVYLSQKRFDKYKILINAIFEIYAQCSHYRTLKVAFHKDNGSKYVKTDALRQLLDRLDVLTSNSLLSGRKNYVATGVYYSNKHLTDFSQLDFLDRYLQEKVNDRNSFNPPSNLFNYGENNGYDENLELIKKRLCEFSFRKGYEERKLHKNGHFGHVLLELQRIYHSKVNK